MAVTQIIKLDLNNHKADDIIIRVGESYTRKIVFIPGTYEGDDFTPTEFYGREDGPRALFRLVKPDRSFVMNNLTVVHEVPDTGVYSCELVPDEYMSQVAGIGYYDIRINDSDTEDEFLYTVQGRVLIDDDMITDSMIESVAASNGFVFPDDFLTSADLSDYATKEYVDDAIATIDLTDYATKEYVDEALANVGGLDYETTETKIGTYENKDLYSLIKVPVTTSISGNAGSVWQINITNMPANTTVISVRFIIRALGNVYKGVMYPTQAIKASDNTIYCYGIMAGFTSYSVDYAIVEYYYN